MNDGRRSIKLGRSNGNQESKRSDGGGTGIRTGRHEMCTVGELTRTWMRDETEARKKGYAIAAGRVESENPGCEEGSRRGQIKSGEPSERVERERDAGGRRSR